MVRRDSVGRQLGLGFGKGRRVIKTIICGDALQAALDRQRQWCQRHGVEEAAPLRMAKADLRPVRAGLLVPPRPGSAVDPVAAERHSLTPRENDASGSSSSSGSVNPLASYTE